MTKINISLFETVSQVKTVAFLWYHVKLSQSSVKTETSQPYPAEVFNPFTCAARAPIKSPQQAWHSTKTSLLPQGARHRAGAPSSATHSEASGPVWGRVTRGSGPSCGPWGPLGRGSSPTPSQLGAGGQAAPAGPSWKPCLQPVCWVDSTFSG